MSSFSALSPIVATAIYTNVYNATSDLPYPWSSTYLFTSAGFFVIGDNFSILRLNLSLERFRWSDNFLRLCFFGIQTDSLWGRGGTNEETGRFKNEEKRPRGWLKRMASGSEITVQFLSILFWDQSKQVGGCYNVLHQTKSK